MSIRISRLGGATMVFVSILPVASAMVIIDDFRAGPHVLTDTTANAGTEYATQSGLPVQQVVGGVRHMQVYATLVPASVEVGGGLMQLHTPNSTTYYTISYNANPGGHGAGAMLNLDLTSMDRFQVTFHQVVQPVSFQIWVRSGTQTKGTGDSITSPGLYEIPFTRYTGINWADVDMVYLSIQTGYMPGGTAHTMSFSDFQVVPEPALFALFAGLGCAALLCATGMPRWRAAARMRASEDASGKS